MKKYDFNIVAQWEAKHGQLVGEIQDRTLRVTAYSPQTKLTGPRMMPVAC